MVVSWNSRLRLTLAPRTRSSHSGAAIQFANFGFKGALNHRLASVPLIPKFAQECAASVCELRNRDTSAGLGPIATRMTRAATFCALCFVGMTLARGLAFGGHACIIGPGRTGIFPAFSAPNGRSID